MSWVDALVDICERSYDHETSERRDRFRINMFFDLTDPVPARWADRSPVPDSIRQHLTCDGTFTPTFVANGHPISVANPVAAVPERTRRLVLYRDQGCRVPWCTRTRWLDVHHITHREHGGITELANLVALCRRCHRAHHRGDLGIVGNADHPDGLTFTDHHGRPRTAAPTITAPDGPPPDPHHPYQHPPGERLHRRWLFLSDPPNTHHPPPPDGRLVPTARRPARHRVWDTGSGGSADGRSDGVGLAVRRAHVIIGAALAPGCVLEQP